LLRRVFHYEDFDINVSSPSPTGRKGTNRMSHSRAELSTRSNREATISGEFATSPGPGEDFSVLDRASVGSPPSEHDADEDRYTMGWLTLHFRSKQVEQQYGDHRCTGYRLRILVLGVLLVLISGMPFFKQISGIQAAVSLSQSYVHLAVAFCLLFSTFGLFIYKKFDLASASSNILIVRAIHFALMLYYEITLVVMAKQYYDTQNYDRIEPTIQAHKFLPFLIGYCLPTDFLNMSVHFAMNLSTILVGHFFYVQKGSYVFQTSGAILLTVVGFPLLYIQDRTARKKFVQWKQTQSWLEDAKKEAENANQVKRNFLSYIFHEIRVPMNAIAIGIDIIEQEEEKKEAAKDNDSSNGDDEESVVKMLKRQTETIGHILDDVLSLQKIEEGKFEIQSSPFSLNKMLKNVVWGYNRICTEKKVHLELVVEDKLKIGVFRGDQYRLRQVVANFISNALKFTPRDGLIKVKAEKVEDQKTKEQFIEVSVRDSGVGISKEDQRKLFQPYIQISAGELQKGRGTGLGLNISKHIIRQHGGRIGVKSIQNVGSKFFFQIPLIEVHDLAGQEMAKTPSEAAVILKTGKVLWRTHGFENGFIPTQMDPASQFRKIEESLTMEMEESKSKNAGSPQSHSNSPVQVTVGPLTTTAIPSFALENKDEEEGEDAPETPVLITRLSKGNSLPRTEEEAKEFRCLLVEDSIPNSKLLGRMITSWKNFKVTYAYNGKEAVSLFEAYRKEHVDYSEPFDVVLMDKEMPGKLQMSCFHH
jgi:signal transduction histidine kinase